MKIMGLERGEPVFKTDEEYEAFCIEFEKSVRPKLEKNRVARHRSALRLLTDPRFS